MAKRSQQPRFVSNSSSLVKRRIFKTPTPADIAPTEKISAAILQNLRKGRYEVPSKEGQLKRVTRSKSKAEVVNPAKERNFEKTYSQQVAKRQLELLSAFHETLDFFFKENNCDEEEQKTLAQSVIDRFLAKRPRRDHHSSNLSASTDRAKVILDELLNLKRADPLVSKTIQKHKLAKDFGASAANNQDLIGKIFNLPVTAPKLWPGKGKSSEGNLLEFAENTYGNWLENPHFSLTYLRELDRPLYQSLFTWHKEHGPTEIPTKLAKLFCDGRSRATLLADAEIIFRGIKDLSDVRKMVLDKKRADSLYQHFRRHDLHLKHLIATLQS